MVRDDPARRLDQRDLEVGRNPAARFDFAPGPALLSGMGCGGISWIRM
jgi:hypothetical protein